MAQCRDCRAEISFARLRSGKWHPVESLEPETYYLMLSDRRPPQRTIVTPAGDRVQGRLVDRLISGACRVEGSESHFPSCRGASGSSGAG